MMSSYAIDPGTSLPRVSEMTDFNMWAWNSRVFPGIDPLPVRLGDRVRVRMANLTMTNHPIHLHGHHFSVSGTDDFVRGTISHQSRFLPVSEAKGFAKIGLSVRGELLASKRPFASIHLGTVYGPGKAFAAKLDQMIEMLAEQIHGVPPKAARKQAVATLATMMGTIVLARIAGSGEFSDEVLGAGREAALGRATAKKPAAKARH